MNNIVALRELLFRQLSLLSESTSDIDFERARIICSVADRVIDTARLEVQLAAVLKGATDVPFIESQDPDHPSNKPSRPSLAPADPMERVAQILNSGPPADHPWRQRDRHRT